GRTTDRGAHELQRPRVHDRAQARTADRRRTGAVRVSELLVQPAQHRAEPRLRGARALDTRARHRRVARSGPRPRRSAMAAARRDPMSPPESQVSTETGDRALAELAEGARAAGRFALDTEFM